MVKEIIVVLGVVCAVFHDWFGQGVISAGDLGFFFPLNIREYWQLPLAWESFRGVGMGGYALPFQQLYFVNLLWGFLGPWVGFALAERLLWLWPIVFLGLVDAYFLACYVELRGYWWLFVWLILALNTYILMIIGGGQITVALGYLLFVLAFVLFLRAMMDEKVKRLKVVYFSWGLVFLVICDPRFAYLLVLVLGFYFLFGLFFRTVSLVKFLKVLVPAGLITLLVHSYWWIPLAVFRGVLLPVGYEKADWVRFLSFASFSGSLSLLHPNWPENIFGKTYFMKPGFLLLPILAYSSLFFLKKKNKVVLFFVFLALVGAFLAKGANPPLGGFYYWLFDYLPGMKLFRDPVKFYTFTALGYAVLIPFAVANLNRLRRERVRRIPIWTEPFFLLVVLLYLVRPVLTGEVKGAFKARPVPGEYLLLGDFLESQGEFFRTLWLPKKSRFGYYSNAHPAIDGEGYFLGSVDLPDFWGKGCGANDRCYVRELGYFLEPQAKDRLARMAVKYVIVPFDSEEEIFLREREYDWQQREEVEKFLDSISWLKKMPLVSKMAVYRVAETKDHFFFSEGEVAKVTDWRMVNPTQYILTLQVGEKPATLVFSESYDPFWRAKLGKESIVSKPDRSGSLNTFFIDRQGEVGLTVEYAPQRYLGYGLMISMAGVALLGLLSVF